MAEKNEPKRDRARGEKNEARSAARAARRRRVLHAVGLIISLVTTGAVAATIVVGHGPLMARAAELKRSDLKVAFDWPPLAGRNTSRTADGNPATWMGVEQRQELERLALNLLTGDPFDLDALERARSALRETGWFHTGPEHPASPWLRRLENGVVVIGGRWRAPVAAVRTSRGDRLVSRDGEALPVLYPIGRSSLPVVLGVPEPAPPPGSKWPGAGLGQVQAGLRLAAFLHGIPGADQIAGIDVADYPSSHRLVIVTTTGGRIVWGGPPDEFLPGQAPAATKRQRLIAVFQRFGQLDAGRADLDLRPEDGVYTVDTSLPPVGQPPGPKQASRTGSSGKNRR